MSNFNRLSPVIFLALFSYLISPANLLASAGACTAVLKIDGKERSLALDGLRIALSKFGYQLKLQKSDLSELLEIQYVSDCEQGCWTYGSYVDTIEYSTNIILNDEKGSGSHLAFHFSHTQLRDSTWDSRRPLFVNGFTKGLNKAKIGSCR